MPKESNEIKPTGIKLNGTNLYYIEYSIGSSRLGSVTFTPKPCQRNLIEFEVVVNKSKKNFKIINWSSWSPQLIKLILK